MKYLIEVKQEFSINTPGRMVYCIYVNGEYRTVCWEKDEAIIKAQGLADFYKEDVAPKIIHSIKVNA